MSQGRDTDLAIPIAAFTPLARNRPDRERAVFKDLKLPDDLIGREFRLTVRYLPTREGSEASVVFLGGTITGFELSGDAMRLHISAPSFADRRVEYLDACPEYEDDNGEWRLVLEAPHGVHPDVSKVELRFPCHLELLEPRKSKQD